MKTRRSVRQIRRQIFNERYKAMQEFNHFDHNTTMICQIRNAERLNVLSELAKFVGGIKPIRFKPCGIAACTTQILDTGTRRIYCSDACRSKAYRQRHKL